MKNIVNNMSWLLAEVERPEWVANSFPIIEAVLAVIISLCAIFMIVAVVAQKGESNGITGVTGSQADTFYNRNKSASLQGKLKKWVMIDAIIILVLSIAFLILTQIYYVGA